jgi:predicted DNA-binding antitoxin AbrB/MazE fold protein
MLTIRVRFENGVFVPEQPVDIPDGQTGTVILEQNQEHSSPETMQAAWRDLLVLIDERGVHTGIEDLAEQHDHYLYGTNKREHSV